MGVVVACALLVAAAPAQAAVTSAFARGELTARSNAGDAIVITCAADGRVRVNGAQPGTGRVACSKIMKIQVEGGPATNLVDLSSVAPRSFSVLASVVIRGGGDNDALVGSPIPDSIFGDEGDDFVDGGKRGDTVDGGAGHDQLLGFDGHDKLLGGEGNDRLEGEAGADRLEEEGGDGNAGLLGGDDDDTVLGGDGDDSRLNGNGGNDTISGGDGNDILFGGADRDELDGDGGDDRLTGDLPFSSEQEDWKGDDVLDGSEGMDRVDEEGNMDFTLEDGALRGVGVGCRDPENCLRTVELSGVEAATLGGGGLSNTIDASAFTGPVTLLGGGGDDTLIGGPANDEVGGAKTSAGGENGADSLTGGGGDDEFYGGASADDSVVESGDVDFTVAGPTTAEGIVGTLAGVGNDKLKGVEIADLTGGAGANTLDASAFSGKAVLDGAAGVDELTGGTGGDRLTGGADDDTLAGNNGVDVVDESGDVGFTLSNTQLVGLGTDGLSGIEEADLTGGAGANTLDASAFSGKAVLDGGAGVDELTGGTGGDRLSGGADTDTLDGNGGVDVVDESGDVNFTLSNNRLEGRGTDGLQEIEEADLTGGAGANTLDASAFPGKAVLDGGAGGDELTGGEADDTLAGGDGGDALLGNGGNDTATGGPGDDALAGGPGEDVLGRLASENGETENAGVDAFWGEEGNDTVNTNDNIAEWIACGAGHDRLNADFWDRHGADCEDVGRSGGASPRADRSVALRASSGRIQSGGKVALMGRVRSVAEPAHCQPNQEVALQRARPGSGRFGTFERARTNGRGAFALTTRVTDSYVYRAKLPATVRCLGAYSDKQRVTVVGG